MFIKQTCKNILGIFNWYTLFFINSWLRSQLWFSQATKDYGSIFKRGRHFGLFLVMFVPSLLFELYLLSLPSKNIPHIQCPATSHSRIASSLCLWPVFMLPPQDLPLHQVLRIFGVSNPVLLCLLCLFPYLAGCLLFIHLSKKKCWAICGRQNFKVVENKINKTPHH